MVADRPTRPRPRRSDGEKTYSAIVAAAVRLASVEGLGQLTIGRLAEEAGVSKSGLYAHFGSKSQLQLDVINAAREIFDREVVETSLDAPPGRPQLEVICESYLSYIERSVFPGGCFFAGMLAEFDAQTGAPHEEIAADQREWTQLLEGMATDAVTGGEFTRDVDIAQLVFELTASIQLANYYFVLFEDPTAIERARTAIDATLTRASS
jgi:AcrR family transcriptional regulator